jgi:cell division septation protein DedD
VHEGDEASYYEIALTNRQVLVAFVILLVCMLASFFAGLWAGRGGTLEAGAQAAVAEAQPAPDTGLEEFKFFSEPEEKEAADLKEIAEQPNPKTTLAEDVGAKVPPVRKPEPPPSRPDSQKTTPEKASPEPAPKETAAKPAPKEAPKETAPKAVAPAADGANPAIPRTTARRPPPPAGSELVIQVFSSHEVRQARKVLRQLLDAGYGAFLSPVEVDQVTMYRVRIGPFADRPAAEKTATEVKSRFKLETWITAN